MKFAPISLVLPLFLVNVAPVAGQFKWIGDVVDSFLGDDKPPGKEDKPGKASEEEATEHVMQSLSANAVMGPVFSDLGSYITGSGNAATEVSEGRRAYNCIMQGANAGGTGRMMPFFVSSAVESIAYGVFYHTFSSPEDIDVICPQGENDGERRALATVNKMSNLRRRTSHGVHGAVPRYPYLNPDDIYTGEDEGLYEAQNDQLNEYLGGDVNDRLAIGALADDLNDQIVVYQTSSQNTQVAGEIIYGLGEFISTVIPGAGVTVAEANLDIGATVRALGTFLQAIASATATNVARRQRTLLKVQNHMKLIDSAEIEAAYKNSDALLEKIESLEALVADMQERPFFAANP